MKIAKMTFTEPYAPFQWDIPEYFNIARACLDDPVERGLGEKVAMAVENEKTGYSEITYSALKDMASRFALLLQELGLTQGERILIRLPNCLEYPITFFGALRYGAIAVPTSALLTGEEVRYIAKNSEASVIVTHKDMWGDLDRALSDVASLKYVILVGDGELPKGSKQFIDWRRLSQEISGTFACVSTKSEDPAYLVYTSGTTGYPKGVLHAHRALLGRLPAAWYWFPFSEGRDEKILHSGKFNWTYVLGTALMDPLYHGKSVLAFEGKNEAPTWIRLIAQHKCTIFIGVPTIYRQILQKTSYTAEDVPTLRHCMCAGEHLSNDIFHEWRRRFRQDIYEAIGMSECSYYISHSRFRPTRPGSAGIPQPGHEIHIIDENFQDVPTGEEGMIAIPLSDPGLFLRYWQLPEEDERLRRHGFFLTGDYARQDEDGYIWFLGRKDDIIKTFGYRVSPHEIERVYKDHPAVLDCVALGEELTPEKILPVIVVIRDPNVACNEEELLEYGRKYLAEYKRPKKVYFAQDFPRTKNGKVLRSELKKLLQSGALHHAGKV
ncbi:MAG: acyl-CoA synthetase [Leptospiraceae bacterium]|nr:acyl-CoA synthetase [Leptospiraceae bacterium]MDW8307284.1 acyl-CoA synthetase [Leptospiraceae bacterium]